MKNLHRTYSNVPIIYQFHPSCQTVTETTPFSTIKSSTGLTYNHNITMLDIKRGMEFSSKDFKVGKCEGEKVVDGETMPLV